MRIPIACRVASLLVLVALVLGPGTVPLPAQEGEAGEEEEPGVEDGVRTRDLVYVDGRDEPLVGEIIEELPDKIRFQRAGSQIVSEIPRSDILDIVRRETPREVYERRAGRLPSDDAAGHLELARWCLRHDLPVAADEEAWGAMRADPSLEEAYEVYVRAWMRLEERVEGSGFREAMLDDEIRAYRWAREHGVTLPLISWRLGVVRAALGLHEAAIEALEPVVFPEESGVDAPDEPGMDVRHPAALELGRILVELGRPAEAEEAYAVALSLEDEPAPATLLASARARFAAGDVDGAVERIEAVRSDEAPRPEAALGLLACHLLRDDLEAAREVIAELQEMALEGRRLASLDLGRGLVALREGRVADAVSAFDAALATDPGFYPAEMGRAMAARLTGDRRTAARRFARAASRAPSDDGLPRFLEAETWIAASEPSRARSALREALEQGMDLGEVMLVRARLEETEGEPARALRLLRYAEVSRPTAEVAYRIGRLAARLDRTDEAREAFRTALERSPGHVPSTVGLAWLHYDEGEYEAALGLLDEARNASEGPFAAYAARARERIRRARTRLEWRDVFRRGPEGQGARPGPEILNRWQEDEQAGIRIGIRRGAVVFGGPGQSQEGEGPTRLVREVERRGLIHVMARLDLTDAADAAEAGLGIVASGVEIRVFRSGDRLLEKHRGRRGDWSDPVALGRWPGGGPHDLALEIDEQTATRVEVLLDGERRGEVQLPSGLEGRGIQAVVYGVASPGTTWGMELREAVIQVQAP